MINIKVYVSNKKNVNVPFPRTFILQNCVTLSTLVFYFQIVTAVELNLIKVVYTDIRLFLLLSFVVFRDKMEAILS
jgi:hypothetical protein